MTVSIALGSIHSRRKELEFAARTYQKLNGIQVCRECWDLYPEYDPVSLYGDIAIIHLPEIVQFSNTIQFVK